MWQLPLNRLHFPGVEVAQLFNRLHIQTAYRMHLRLSSFLLSKWKKKIAFKSCLVFLVSLCRWYLAMAWQWQVDVPPTATISHSRFSGPAGMCHSMHINWFVSHYSSFLQSTMYGYNTGRVLSSIGKSSIRWVDHSYNAVHVSAVCVHACMYVGVLDFLQRPEGCVSWPCPIGHQFATTGRGRWHERGPWRACTANAVIAGYDRWMWHVSSAFECIKCW